MLLPAGSIGTRRKSPVIAHFYLVILSVGVSVFLPLSVKGQAPTQNQSGPDSSAMIKPGIVMEKFDGPRVGAKLAGMQEGDVLLTWSRGDAKGVLDSPFDLSLVLADQLPRDSVSFEGLRGSEKQVWVEKKRWWGASQRPNFSGALLDNYREGQKLAEAGKLTEAAQRWRAMISQAPRSQFPWLGPWLLFQAAQLLQDGQRWKEADDAYQEAILQAQSSVPAVRAQLLIAWATSLEIRGDYDQAETHFLEAESESRQAGAQNLMGKCFGNLGWIAKDRGDYAKAEEYFRENQEILEKLEPGSLDAAEGLISFGALYTDRGDLAKGEEYYRKAQLIYERLAPGSVGTAIILNDLGQVAHERRELAQAEAYYRQALKIIEKVYPGQQAHSVILSNLASVLDDRGIDKEAEELLRQSLAIAQKIAPQSSEEASTLQVLGRVALHRSDLNAAEQFYLQALAISQKLAPEGLSTFDDLSSLGDMNLKSGNLVRAEEYYRQALALIQKLAPESANHAEALAGLANIARQKQQPEIAIQFYDQALHALESQATRLGGSDEQRARFRGKYEDYYQSYIELLVSQNQAERAFQVSEQARARSLLETLAEGHVDIHKGVDAALLEQEHSLQTAIMGKSDRRIRLLGGKHSEEEISAVNKELDGLLARYHELQDKIRATSPVYAAITLPQPLSAKEVQQLLDSDTALLEYSLGELHSYVFLLTTNSIQVYELPPRKTMETAARHVYQLLTSHSQQIKGETPVQRNTRWAAAKAQYPEAAGDLSRMVLGPLADQLKAKRLLVISDGALQYIPFSVLPAGAPARPPLVADHEIINLPSASVLAVLRQAESTHHAAPNSVAVLADPVFSNQDTRVLTETARGIAAANMSAAAPSSPDDPISRCARDVGLTSLPRLLFSRQEAEAIVSSAPRGSSLAMLDFKATRAMAMDPQLEQYRILHFATHGLVDSEHPELSGLVLSLVDERGEPQNGFLNLQDIYNLTLPADLVVLSACKTALGKEIRSEGLIGLTQGFMYAGASRVVATLWSIDDLATATFMAGFYKSMLRDGLTPSAALRKSQMQMRKQKRWSNPYYWAAFVIQGDWAPETEKPAAIARSKP